MTVYNHTSEDPQPDNNLPELVIAVITLVIVAAWIVAVKYFNS